MAHKLANAWSAIHVRDDLDEEIWAGQFAQDRAVVQLLVLLPHTAGGTEHRAKMQRAGEHFALVAKFWYDPPENLPAPGALA
jgi:hypothetical protein